MPLAKLIGIHSGISFSLPDLMNVEERDDFLMSIRPEVRVSETFRSEEERFHHITLRPLLKLQNALLLTQFAAWLQENKTVLHNKPAGDQRNQIEHICKTNKRLRAQVFGIIIGMMTQEEYQIYLHHQRELNKRITSMWAKRIFDQREELRF